MEDGALLQRFDVTDMVITNAGSVGDTVVTVVGSGFVTGPAAMKATSAIPPGATIPQKNLQWMEAKCVVTTSGVATVQTAVTDATTLKNQSKPQGLVRYNTIRNPRLFQLASFTLKKQNIYFTRFRMVLTVALPLPIRNGLLTIAT